MISRKTISAVETEIDRVRVAIAAWREKNKDTRDEFIQGYNKESGTLRRASMDLTRALAELRSTRDAG